QILVGDLKPGEEVYGVSVILTAHLQVGRLDPRGAAVEVEVPLRPGRCGTARYADQHREKQCDGSLPHDSQLRRGRSILRPAGRSRCLPFSTFLRFSRPPPECRTAQKTAAHATRHEVPRG